MAKFSSRFGYDPKDSKTPIFESAPEWIRTAYINDILNKLTYIDQDSRYKNEKDFPLGIKELIKIFSRICRQDLPYKAYDSFMCVSILSDMIVSCDWYHFYDFVEKVGKCLQDAEAWRLDEDWIISFGSKQYIQAVNSLFKEENVSWRLDLNSDFIREIPAAFEKVLKKTESSLTHKYEPARSHYIKAVRYIYNRPIDPENAIKEIVCALESVGKILYPGNATLGDVIKSLRKADPIPPKLIPIIDKFYTFANSEHGIRHGGTNNSSIQLQDAEFCLHVGVALIRYLISCNDQKL